LQLILVYWFIGLFFYAVEIVEKLTPKVDEQQGKQVHLFRVINVVIVGLILYKAVVTPRIEENWLSKTLTILLITYVFFMVFKVYSYFMHSRYGKQWETMGNR